MPVLPLVASRMVFSGVREPVFSPSRIIHSAGLSLTDPPGLYHSALPRMLTPGTSAETLGNSRSGVLPTSSVTFVPARRLIRVIMSGLIIQVEGSSSRMVGRCLTNVMAERLERCLPAMVGALRSSIHEGGAAIPVRGRRLAQILQNFGQAAPAAGEDGGVQLGVGARLALPELHHQVLELLGRLGLEGEDELVVVYPEAVARVVLDGVVLAP